MFPKCRERKVWKTIKSQYISDGAYIFEKARNLRFPWKRKSANPYLWFSMFPKSRNSGLEVPDRILWAFFYEFVVWHTFLVCKLFHESKKYCETLHMIFIYFQFQKLGAWKILVVLGAFLLRIQRLEQVPKVLSILKQCATPPYDLQVFSNIVNPADTRFL